MTKMNNKVKAIITYCLIFVVVISNLLPVHANTDNVISEFLSIEEEQITGNAEVESAEGEDADPIQDENPIVEDENAGSKEDENAGPVEDENAEPIEDENVDLVEDNNFETTEDKNHETTEDEKHETGENGDFSEAEEEDAAPENGVKTESNDFKTLDLETESVLNQTETSVFYVSTDGSNSNDGSIEKPFRTITHALATIPSNSELYIKEGTYENEIPNLKDKNDITIKSYEGQQVSIIHETAKYFTIINSNNITLEGISIAKSSGTNDLIYVIGGQNINFNKINGSGGAITFKDTNDFTFSNSFITASTGDGGVTLYNAVNGKVYNNVIYENTKNGIYILGTNCTNNLIINNTFAQNIGYDIFILTHATLGLPVGNSFHNNIITKGLLIGYDNRGLDALNGNNFDYNTYSENLKDNVGVIKGSYSSISFSALQDLGKEENGLNGDINLVDYENKDYRLLEGSICIGSGTAENAPNTDITGAERQADSIDIGAYKFVPGIEPPALALVSHEPVGTNENINVAIAARFNYSISQEDIAYNFKVTDEQNNTVAGQVSVTDKTVTFTPEAPLLYSTTYTVTLTEGIKSLDGKKLLEQQFSWTFKTKKDPGQINNALQIGDPTSVKGFAIRPIPEPQSDDYYVAFDYMYPSGQSMNGFRVWTSYDGQKYLDASLVQVQDTLNDYTAAPYQSLDIKLQPDIWHNIMIHYKEDKTYEIFINGKQARNGTLYSKPKTYPDTRIKHIGYIGDVSSAVHDGCAFYDNIKIYTADAVIYENDFTTKDLTDWALYGTTGITEEGCDPAVVESITMSSGKNGLLVGEATELEFTAILSNGREADLKMAESIDVSTESENISIENNNGSIKVTAIAPGAADMKVTAKLMGYEKEAAFRFIITDEENPLIYKLKLEADTDKLLPEDTVQLRLIGQQTNGTDVVIQSFEEIEFASSEENVIQLDIDNTNNTVSARSLDYGKSTISARATINGIDMYASMDIFVVKLDRVELSSIDTILFVGNHTSLTLRAWSDIGDLLDISKADSIVYESSNENIVKIEEHDGKMYAEALAPGAATVNATVTVRGISKSSSINYTVDNLTSAKTRSTFYTEKKVTAARENANTYEWAMNIKEAAVANADKYLVHGYEFLWNLITPQSIPRSYAVNQPEGCLNCGKEIDKYGNYPYKMDPANDPWKIQCPNCGMKFPTNDFKAYYESGLDEHGIFNKDLANKELLVNTSYPDKGSDWGVDDGYGYVDQNGNIYTFIAYYNHWGLWYSGIISNALNAFRDAYLYTGDLKYARAGIIMLDRIADVYPDMDIWPYKISDGFKNSNGNSNKGKIIGSIWETGLAKIFLYACDAFFPAIDDDEIIDFLSNKADQYDLGVLKKSATGIKRNIEDGIVRQIYPAVRNNAIRGNSGMHQSTLALASVVMDSLPETKEWLDFIFRSGETPYFSSPEESEGGNILMTFVDKIDRDGHGNEGSPGYNSLWLSQYLELADILDGYELEGYQLDNNYDLYKNVKFKKMFYSMYPIMLSDIYGALIGDTGTTGGPLNLLTKSQFIKAFEKYKDPIFAQLIYYIDRGDLKGLNSGIFSENPEKIAEDIQGIIDQYGPLNLESENLTGFGFATLRDGKSVPKVAKEGYYFFELDITGTSQEHRFFDSNKAVQLEAAGAGDYIEFSFDVPREDEYDISLLYWRAGTYGIYDITIDGLPLAELDFTGSQSNEISLGRMTLKSGSHKIKFVCTGKNETSTGYKMAVIQLQLKEAEEESQDEENEKDTQRDLTMYYGINTGHGHKDTLNIGMHAFGLDLLPDIGYPEYADVWPHTQEWVTNTISHNTVIVDGKKQGNQVVAIPKHFDNSELVKIIDVEAPKVYPQTDIYRRTTAMIRVNAEDSYAIDLFRVKGGTDHRFSFHAADAVVTSEGLELVKQADENGNYIGSYAGPSIAYGKASDTTLASSGFTWLKNVEQASDVNGMFSVNWNVKDTWDIYENGRGAATDVNLKLTMLGDFTEVALADGIPPTNKPGNPSSLRYLIAQRKGESGSALDSLFLSVIEPYKGESFVKSITPVTLKVDGQEVKSNEAKAIKVVLDTGRADYIVYSVNPDITYTVDDKFQFRGFFGVYSEIDGEYIASYINDGELIGEEITEVQSRLTGTVVDFTKDLSTENEIKVQVNETEFNVDDLVGRYIYIENDKVRNAVYKIKGAKIIEDDTEGNTVITLHIGDLSLIRNWKDNNDFSKGFVYDFAEGANFVIPLSKEISYLAELEDASLEFIKIGSGMLPNFEQDKYKFTVKLPYGVTAIPPVTAKATNANAVVEITQASDIPGKAIIKVTAEDGVTVKTYEVEFIHEAKPQPEPDPDPEPVPSPSPDSETNHSTEEPDSEDVKNNIEEMLEDTEIKSKSKDEVVKRFEDIIDQAGRLKAGESSNLKEELGQLAEKTIARISEFNINELADNSENAIITENENARRVEVTDKAIADAIKSLEETHERLKSNLEENGFNELSAAIAKSKEIKFVFETDKDISFGLTVEAIDELSKNETGLVIDNGSSDGVLFRIPPRALDAEYIAKYMKKSGEEMEDSQQTENSEGIESKKLDIIIRNINQDDLEREQAAKDKHKGSSMFMTASKAFDLSIMLNDGSSEDGNGTYIQEFNGKLAIEIPLNEGIKEELSNGKVNRERLGVYRYNPETKQWDYAGGKVDPETGRISFTTNHLSVYEVFEYNKTFKDIEKNWAREFIEVLASKHIVHGINDESFQPGRKVTRAEFTKMVLEALDLVDYDADTTFPDVKEGSWYYVYAATAQKLGVLKDATMKFFKPEETITREEMAVIAYKASQAAGIELAEVKKEIDFDDDDQISEYAKEAVKAMQKAGILEGTGQNKFLPKNNSVRAEAAKIIYMLIEQI